MQAIPAFDSAVEAVYMRPSVTQRKKRDDVGTLIKKWFGWCKPDEAG